MALPAAKQPKTLRGNVMSFLFGFCCAYVFLQQTGLVCAPVVVSKETSTSSSSSVSKTLTTNSLGSVSTNPSIPTVPEGQLDFYKLGQRFGTDKTAALTRLPACLEDSSKCIRKGCDNERCRSWGHYYQTFYQQWLGPYSRADVEPFQFLEIGFFKGSGYQTYREFLTSQSGDKNEVHSMEISCLPEGKQEDGKWPWGNFAANNKNYDAYLKENRLHCGDASKFAFLNKIWTEQMNRPDAPPLKIVVDDGSHLSKHMVQTVFFWLPRIEPHGLLFVEDIQPINDANRFRIGFLPKLMADLHYCGDPNEKPDKPCFPALRKLIQSIHCEFNICVIQRNAEPSQKNLSEEESTAPLDALDLNACHSFEKPFGNGMQTGR